MRAHPVRSLALFLLVGVASIAAAEVPLTPAVPIVPVSSDAVVFNGDAIVVSNGHGYLATYDTLFRGHACVAIDENGEQKTPRPVEDGVLAVAPNGSGYAIARGNWSEPQFVVEERTAAGDLTGRSVTIELTADSVRLACNGERCLVGTRYEGAFADFATGRWKPAAAALRPATDGEGFAALPSVYYDRDGNEIGRASDPGDCSDSFRFTVAQVSRRGEYVSAPHPECVADRRSVVTIRRADGSIRRQYDLGTCGVMGIYPTAAGYTALSSCSVEHRAAIDLHEDGTTSERSLSSWPLFTGAACSTFSCRAVWDEGRAAAMTSTSEGTPQVLRGRPADQFAPQVYTAGSTALVIWQEVHDDRIDVRASVLSPSRVALQATTIGSSGSDWWRFAPGASGIFDGRTWLVAYASRDDRTQRVVRLSPASGEREAEDELREYGVSFLAGAVPLVLGGAGIDEIIPGQPLLANARQLAADQVWPMLWDGEQYLWAAPRGTVLNDFAMRYLDRDFRPTLPFAAAVGDSRETTIAVSPGHLFAMWPQGNEIHARTFTPESLWDAMAYRTSRTIAVAPAGKTPSNLLASRTRDGYVAGWMIEREATIALVDRSATVKASVALPHTSLQTLYDDNGDTSAIVAQTLTVGGSARLLLRRVGDAPIPPRPPTVTASSNGAVTWRTGEDVDGVAVEIRVDGDWVELPRLFPRGIQATTVAPGIEVRVRAWNRGGFSPYAVPLAKHRALR